MHSLINLSILVMGFTGQIAQILLLRELLIIFSGNELSIGIILANWLILEGIGAHFLGKKAENIKYTLEIFVSLTIIFSLSLVATIYFTRILKNILGISAGQGVGILTIFYSSFFVLLVPSITHGALFTFGCKIHSLFSGSKIDSVSKVYVYETIGTLAGGIICTYLLIPYLGSMQITIVLGVLYLSVIFLLILLHSKRRIVQKILGTGCCIILLLGIFSFFSGLANKLHYLSIKSQWRRQNLVHYQNSIYGNICVIESGGQYTFFTDGIPYIITPVPDIIFVEEFVHLPFLLHSAPNRVLVLSGGAGGVINEILKHPQVEVIDYTELDPLLLKLLKKFTTKLTEYELNSEMVKVHYIDGRLFLKTSEKDYDIILIGLKEPSNLQVNRFFTKEFFSLVKKKLRHNGILSFTLPGSLTYLNDELINLNSCIFNTLKQIFLYVRVFPGDGYNIFIASDSEEILLADKEWLIKQIKIRNIKANIAMPRHIEYKLHPRWSNWFYHYILKKGTERINLDFTPIGMFYTISYWTSLFNPDFKWVFRLAEKLNLKTVFLFFLILIFLYFIIRSIRSDFFGTGIPFSIGSTGFAGMIFDLVLIFTFQAVYGFIFFWLGLFITFCMVGIAVGAIIVNSLLSQRIKDDIKFFIKLELVIICFSFSLPFMLNFMRPYLDNPATYAGLRMVFLGVSFISGIIIGAEFPLANKIYLRKRTNFSRAVGLLYSSDLLGGCLAGIVGSVVLLPVLGILNTCMMIVMLKVFSLVLLIGQSRVC